MEYYKYGCEKSPVKICRFSCNLQLKNCGVIKNERRIQQSKRFTL